MVLEKAEEDLRRGSTFIPLYNGIEDSYGIDSIGHWFVIGVFEGNTTPVGVTKIIVHCLVTVD